MIKSLRYQEDVRSLLFVSLAFLFMWTPFFIDIHGWQAALWITVSGVSCFIVCVINHNHTHVSVFNSTRLNQAFSILLTLAKGSTSSGVIVPHNMNHHVHNNDHNDWARSALAGEGHGIIRLLRYIAKSSVTMAKERKAEQAPRLSERRQKALLIERLCLLAYLVLILVVAPGTSLLFVVIPWSIGTLLLITSNFMQHDECDVHSDYNHSRNFLNKTGNWFFLNNGYHTLHHMRPRLHWSRLPDRHDAIADKIDKRFNEDTIPDFFLKQYVFSFKK